MPTFDQRIAVAAFLHGLTPEELGRVRSVEIAGEVIHDPHADLALYRQAGREPAPAAAEAPPPPKGRLRRLQRSFVALADRFDYERVEQLARIRIDHFDGSSRRERITVVRHAESAWLRKAAVTIDGVNMPVVWPFGAIAAAVSAAGIGTAAGVMFLTGRVPLARGTAYMSLRHAVGIVASLIPGVGLAFYSATATNSATRLAILTRSRGMRMYRSLSVDAMNHLAENPQTPEQRQVVLDKISGAP